MPPCCCSQRCSAWLCWFFVAAFLASIRRLARSHEALQRSEAEAQRANQAKSEFLAAMSHELRTPLTSIRGFAELMELRSKDPLIQEQSALIRQGAEHLNALLTEILDLSRIEAGAMPAHHEPVMLPDLLREVTELFRVSAAAKSLQLDTHLHAAATQPLVTDGLKLKQILNNLLSNAIKFTAHGGVELTVEPDLEGQQMLFHVTDTGPGIAPELQDRIFEKFSGPPATRVPSGRRPRISVSPMKKRPSDECAPIVDDSPGGTESHPLLKATNRQ